MKQIKLSTLWLSSLLVLSGCGEEPSMKENVAVIPQDKVIEKPCYNVGETTSFERRDVTGERCQWIGEHNFIVYSEDLSKPEYPGTLPVKPGYAIRRAKEWPREDISDATSYDKPRVQFWWNNVRYNDPEENEYETKNKIWSMKIDGTDLRLVSDMIPSSGVPKGLIRRSPNNRYVAYAYSNGDGLFKEIFDLETQTKVELGRSSTRPYLVWAEDSSYLYYSNGYDRVKYTLKTGKKEVVEVALSESTVIADGKLINVGGLGVGVYDAKTLDRLYTILPEKEFDGIKDIEKQIYRQTAISPNGRFVWGINSYRKVIIDVEAQTWKTFSHEGEEENVYDKVDNLSNSGKETQRGAASIRIRSYGSNDRYLKNGNGAQAWKVIQSGHLARFSNVYNADANGGRFLEVDNVE